MPTTAVAHGVPAGRSGLAQRALLGARPTSPRRELGLGEVGGRGGPVGGQDGGQARAAEGVQHRGDRALGVAGRGERGAEAPAGLARGVEVRAHAAALRPPRRAPARR